TRARGDLRLSAGLLDRRAELRGRLEAYRAKAARLGKDEDERLAALYGAARDVLWTAPCDLRAATGAVKEALAAVAAWEKGPGAPRRTHAPSRAGPAWWAPGASATSAAWPPSPTRPRPGPPVPPLPSRPLRPLARLPVPSPAL